MVGKLRTDHMATTNTALNPRTAHYEWGGPIGAFFMVLTVPLTVLAFNSLCTPLGCTLSLDTFGELYPAIVAAVESAWAQVPLALELYAAWIVFHSILYLLPLGVKKLGQPLRDGTVLTYNINAFQAMIISYVALFSAHYTGYINLADLADLSVPLAIAGIILSLALAVGLYVASFRSPNVMLALGGNSGNPIYDFWVGRELNPRIFALDLKFMCELRPGLIGWTLLSWAYVLKAQQMAVNSSGIALVALFQTWYVADGLWFEAGNCTMMDIVYDGFGMMLACGDLAWVPFLYTLQCRYLAYNETPLSSNYLLLCVCLHIAGYMGFRVANSTKDAFRRDPTTPAMRKLKVLKTSAGKSLITGGIWGICRHPNYVADWLMTLSWSMLCGSGSLLPYFQPAYFALLLIHRQLRDEDQMLIKYGEKDWKAFCKEVPWRLIPYIY
jgi:delta14-sterol reductase